MAEDYGAQLSIKFGNGNMLNIRSATVADLADETKALVDVAADLVASAETVQGHAILAQAFPGAEVIQDAPSRSVPATSGPQGSLCAHGVPMIWKAGTSQKTGKDYKGWFCVVESDPKLKQCAPQFVR